MERSFAELLGDQGGRDADIDVNATSLSASDHVDDSEYLSFPEDVMNFKASSSADDPNDNLSSNFKSEVSAMMDPITLKGLLYDDPWVYIICNLVARKISRQWMGVYRGQRRDARTTAIPDPKNELNDLLERPNPWEGYAEFMYRCALELTLMGNAIIWKGKFSKSLMLLPTEYVELIFDDNQSSLKGYQVSVVDSGNPNSTTLFIPVDEVVHIKIPNPNSIYYGLSVWIPGRRSILFDRYTQEYLLNFYLKQANPGPVMEMTSEANEKQALRLLKSMELRWTGRASQRRTLILPKGVTAKNLTTTFAEQQLKDHLKDNRETIRALLSVPPHELGIQSTGSIGSEETEKQLKNFYTSTIIPYQWLIADAFTRSYQKELGDKKYQRFNNDDVAVLREDEGKKAATANLMLTTMTLNEVRMRMWELEPVDNGDIIPSTEIANTEVTESVPPENNGSELSLLGSKKVSSSESIRNYLKNHWDWWSKRKAAGEEGEIQGEEKRILEILLLISNQKAVITMKVFKKLFKGKSKQIAVLFPPKPTGKRGRQKQSDIEIFQRRLEKALDEAGLEGVYNEDAVPILQNSSILGYDLALNLPFNMPSPDAREALRQENAGKRADIVSARGIESFKGFSGTSTDEIVEIVRQGTIAGKNLGQISDDLLNYHTNITPSKARTIARTEVLTALSLGQEAALQDAAEVIPGMKKGWLSANDTLVRDPHTELDGVIIAHDKAWTNSTGKIRFPRDPLAAAKNRINCRCTSIMIPPGEGIEDEIAAFTGLGS